MDISYELLNIVLLFDIRGLSYSDAPKANSIKYGFMTLAYNISSKSLVCNHFLYEPSIVDDYANVIHLNHENWMEYQLIKHLSPSIIYAHFLNQPQHS